LSDWSEQYKRKLVSFEERAQTIQSGDFISTAIGIGLVLPKCMKLFSTAMKNWKT
jgi:acyl-CoA hydrolase